MKSTLGKVGALALSLAVLGATVWVVSKAWKEGQKTKTA